MKVRYELVYNGSVQRTVTGDSDDLPALRREFWAKVGFPWSGAEVRLVKA